MCLQIIFFKIERAKNSRFFCRHFTKHIGGSYTLLFSKSDICKNMLLTIPIRKHQKQLKNLFTGAFLITCFDIFLHELNFTELMDLGKSQNHYISTKILNQAIYQIFFSILNQSTKSLHYANVIFTSKFYLFCLREDLDFFLSVPQKISKIKSM